MITYNTTPSAAVLAEDNWSRREAQWRAPSVEDGEEIIFDEPGRVLGRDAMGYNGTDYRSHYFRVTRSKYDAYRLRVHHGGGEEAWSLGYNRSTIDALGALDSDARYLLLHAIAKAHGESYRAGVQASAKKYTDAFLDGRLKKRRSQGRARVEIEPAIS
jgi:hypothetical protein